MFLVYTNTWNLQRLWPVSVITLLFTLAYQCAAMEPATLPPLPSISTLPAWAQAQTPPAKRALIIGIHEYTVAKKLATPGYDAQMMSAFLRQIDPKIAVTIVASDQLDRGGLLKSINAFSASLGPGEIALVFFSGHGVERDGINYIVPVDAQVAEPGREGFVYLSVPYLIEKIHEAGAGLAVIILDACRVDPFANTSVGSDVLDVTPEAHAFAGGSDAVVASVAGGAPTPADFSSTPKRIGLSVIDPPQGFIVAFAAAPGKPSFSLFNGEAPSMGSIFTRRLILHASTLNHPISAVFNATGGDVATITGSKQKPFVNAFNAGEFLLLSNNNLAKNEEETWIRTVNGAYPDGELAGLRQFVSVYPAGPYTAAARNRIQELGQRSAAAIQLAVTPGRGKPLVLSGALGLPSVSMAGNSVAVAKRDAYVRSAPFSVGSKIIGVLKKAKRSGF